MHLLAYTVRRSLCGLSLFVWLSFLPAGAATYFVSSEGSDSNPGTNVAAPLRSLACAASNMVAGDVCLIRGGTYRETLRPRHSGTATAPILFQAYSNEVVVLNGADVITRWNPGSNSVYTASVPWDLGTGANQVFVDGAMVHQARLPAFGGGDLLHPATVAVTVDQNDPTLITSTSWGGRPDNFYAGAWFCGGIGERWSWQTARVLSSSDNTLRVDTSTRSDPWFVGSGNGFLWGSKELLVGDNQWHLENRSGSNLLYLRIRGGEDPSLHSVEMKRRLWCIDFNNQSFVTVQGLKFQAGAVCLSGTANVLENCQGRFLSHFMKYTWGYAYDGSRYEGGGVVVSGTNNTVRACTLSDTAGSGIASSGSGNVITRNLIDNTDYSGTYGCAIQLSGCQNQVSFNTAHSSGRDILHCAGAGDSICYNNLFEPGLLCRDLGVVYVWGVNAQCSAGPRTRIAYNWLHDNNRSGGPSPLIYLDNWCRNFVVDHNVLWNSAGDSGIRINAPADGHRIYNNTLFQCDDIGTHTYDMWPDKNPDSAFWTSDRYNFSALNNLVLGSTPQSSLVDPAHFDFRLRSDSAALKAGVAIAGYTENSKSPCGLGAYETGRPVWKPGVDGWCQPRLAMTRTDPETIVLTSSSGAAYFQLLTATNSVPSAIWTAVTNTPSVSTTQWSVALPVAETHQRLFQLKLK